VPQSTAMKPSAQRMPAPLAEKNDARDMGPPVLLLVRERYRERHEPKARQQVRRRRPGRAWRRAGLGRARAGALLGRHQGPEDLPLERRGERSRPGARPSGRLAGAARQRRLHRRHRARLRPSTSRPSASSCCSIPSRTAKPTASTTARSTAPGASGPAPWTMRSAGERRALPARPTSAGTRGRRRLPGHQRPGLQPRRRTMYHNDSRAAGHLRFDLAPDGNALNRRVFLRSARATAIPTG
jgi:hypothetical protein